jgi:hypothetical protein
MKTAFIISSADLEGTRLEFAKEYIESKGYQVEMISCDFNHRRKKYFISDIPWCKQIHVRPYKKNLSVPRLLSHLDFGKGIYKYLSGLKQEPELIYAKTPPNSVFKYVAKYKREHPKVKVVFDIFDMWPETFPIRKLKTVLALPFRIWAGFRNRYIGCADAIIAECDLFRERVDDILETRGIDLRAATVYYGDTAAGNPVCNAPDIEQEVRLCYVGRINNVIDIPYIAALAKGIAADRKVVVEIIGDGERKKELTAALKTAGAEVICHGTVYDEGRKQEIMGGCHFGLNIVREGTFIGLTMKSVDYLKFSLPLINKGAADTDRLIKSLEIGIRADSIEETVQAVCNTGNANMAAFRRNAGAAFEMLFEKSVILVAYEEAIGDLI